MITLQFPDKLIFLMEITSTSNKQLAKVLKVDPSLISRFRKGTRFVPDKSGYFDKMSIYFAKKCTTDYQLSALSEIIGNYCLNKNQITSKTPQVIARWLSNDDTVYKTQADALLSTFNELKFPKTNDSHCCVDFSDANTINDSSIYAYYGAEGRRKASRKLAQLILSSNSIGELKILNEGNTDWAWSDNNFALKTSNDITQFIYQGGTITRIVPQLNNYSLVYDSITRWLPLHTTGQVKTYFYPHLRDNVLYRTLHLAPGVAALFSTDVGDEKVGDVAFLATDPNIVAALDKEFMDYLTQCNSATVLYDQENYPLQLRKSVTDFLECQSSSITILNGLSFVTMPPQVFDSLSTRSDVNPLKTFHSYCINQFLNKLVNYSYTEVFKLDSFEEIIAGRARYTVLGVSNNKELYYSHDEYLIHLKNIVALLENHPNYNVILLKNNEIKSDIYINKKHNVMLLRKEPSFAICNIEYPEMVSAMWEYATKTGYTEDLTRQRLISQITHLIHQIDDYMQQRD